MPPKDKQKKAQDAAKAKAKVKVRVWSSVRGSSFFWKHREPSLDRLLDQSIDERENSPLSCPLPPSSSPHHQYQTVEDKTFGLKNKNKSSKVQR